MSHAPRTSRPDHERHDALLIARAVADDVSDAERRVAESLVARCSDCHALALDLRGLDLSADLLPTPPRTRDFSITPEQAARHRGSPLERFLSALAAPRLRVLQPIAGAALSLGIVLAVAGSVLPSGTGPTSEPGAGAQGPASVGAPAASDEHDTASGAEGGAKRESSTTSPMSALGSDSSFESVPAASAGAAVPDATAGASTEIAASPAGSAAASASGSDRTTGAQRTRRPKRSPSPPSIGAPGSTAEGETDRGTQEPGNATGSEGGTADDGSADPEGTGASPNPQVAGAVPSARPSARPAAQPLDTETSRPSGPNPVVAVGIGIAAVGMGLLALLVVARRRAEDRLLR